MVLSRIFAAALLAALAWTVPDVAFSEGDSEPLRIAAAPSQTGTQMHATYVVEGETVQVLETIAESGEKLIDARPIIEALRGEISFESTLIGVRRFQDGTLMSIDMADGKVRANRTVLGKLPDWTPRETPDTWLTLNAIAVITGCHVSQNEFGHTVLTLDESLRPQFDLDLFVDGRRLAFPGAQPRTIGPILLLPLRDVAEALGHTVEEDTLARTVTVTRVQDGASFRLELATGLVFVNDRPRGVTPNMAYADIDLLLLPSTAIETLTGSHVVLSPGSDRVEVTLDDRLSGSALPGEEVAREAREAGIIVETLGFSVGDNGSLGADLTARVGGFSTLTRYETSGPVTASGALMPGWMATEVQALAGWRATLGDSAPRFGELSGVDTNRIRGVSFRKVRADGSLLAVSAGVPLTGSQSDGDTNQPEFAGFAAGVRLINESADREIGLSVRTSESGASSRVVASVQQDLATQRDTSGEPGLAGVFVSADLGAFSGEASSGLDVRGQADTVYNLSQHTIARASLSYEGGQFRQPLTEGQNAMAGVFDGRVSSRTGASASLTWRADAPWQHFHNVGAATRVASTWEGGLQDTSLSASAGARLSAIDLDLAIDLGHSIQSGGDADASGATSLAVRALKSFKWGMAQATLTRQSDEAGQANTVLVANLGFDPLTRDLGKGASISLAPSVSAIASPETYFGRVGATATATSGSAFGDRFRLSGQVSALQSVNSGGSATDFFASAAAQYDLFGALRLEAAVFSDFRGRTNATLGLRGLVRFNEPRHYSTPLEDRGMLRGRAFYDRNRDGIRQPDEPGIPGIRVGIQGTRLSLSVDDEGFYTIQNLPTGLYGLTVDLRSLPLGLLVSPETPLRATIGDGRITTLDIPIVASGQVRGSVFVDFNANGAPDPGETRLEGARLTLTSEDDPEFEAVQQYPASYGQYAFENLKPGTYRIETRHDGMRASTQFTITDDNLFAVQPLAVPPKPGTPPRNPESAPDVQFTAGLDRGFAP